MISALQMTWEDRITRRICLNAFRTMPNPPSHTEARFVNLAKFCRRVRQGVISALQMTWEVRIARRLCLNAFRTMANPPSHTEAGFANLAKF